MRSKAEHQVAKFFHQRHGVTLYPYPGDEADLQTPCGLNIEVKRETVSGYRFKLEQIYRKQFHLAVLVRNRNRWLQYAIWALPEIQALVIANDGFPDKGPSVHLKCPNTLTWHTLAL